MKHTIEKKGKKWGDDSYRLEESGPADGGGDLLLLLPSTANSQTSKPVLRETCMFSLIQVTSQNSIADLHKA